MDRYLSVCAVTRDELQLVGGGLQSAGECWDLHPSQGSTLPPKLQLMDLLVHSCTTALIHSALWPLPIPLPPSPPPSLSLASCPPPHLASCSLTFTCLAVLWQVGAACLWIASKYEELQPPTASDFVFIADETYSRWGVVYGLDRGQSAVHMFK